MKQILKGKVASNKMKGTVTVEVTRLKKHPLYGKYIKISKKYKSDTKEEIKEGAEVEIELVSPMSKDKKWKVIKTL